MSKVGKSFHLLIQHYFVISAMTKLASTKITSMSAMEHNKRGEELDASTAEEVECWCWNLPCDKARQSDTN